MPTFTPFFFHWRTGVLPPLVTLALKVTAVPVHTVVADAFTVTEGVTVGITVMPIFGEVTVAGLAHVPFDVITTSTVSLSARVVVM
jgi:hypothetical protein